MRILLVSALLLGGSFGLFEWAQAEGLSDAEARTVAVNVFVVGELFYLLNCRSLERSSFRIGFFSNRWVIVGIVVMPRAAGALHLRAGDELALPLRCDRRRGLAAHPRRR